MFGRRIRSALFIDYENVGQFCPAAHIGHWLRWIEEGEFDEGRKRKLIEKRVYWNPSAQRFEDDFKRHGFEVVLCEKFAFLKNGADIRIALDVMESLASKRRIDEFILFAKDTDYVPVLQRLEIKKKQSAILVDEEEERVFTTYDLHADITIPVRIFKQAVTYEPRRPMIDAFRALRRGVSKKSETLPAPHTPIAIASVVASSAAIGRPQQRRWRRDPMAQAVQRTVRVTSLKPNQYTAKEDIVLELWKIRGFRAYGRNAYLGTGSYPVLMREIARRTDRIKVDPVGNGVAVKYIPEEDN